MIQAIDFLKRSFRGQYGLQQQRPLIELRHEVRSDASRERRGGERDARGYDNHKNATLQAPSQERSVEHLDLPDDPDIFLRAVLSRSEDELADDRNHTQRQDERRAD